MSKSIRCKSVTLIFFNCEKSSPYKNLIFMNSSLYQIQQKLLLQPKLCTFFSTNASFRRGVGPRGQDSAFSLLDDGTSSTSRLQQMKWLYLGSWAMNQKNKDTQFFQLSKFKKVKYPYFFIHGPGAKIMAFSLLDDLRPPLPDITG